MPVSLEVVTGRVLRDKSQQCFIDCIIAKMADQDPTNLNAMTTEGVNVSNNDSYPDRGNLSDITLVAIVTKLSQHLVPAICCVGIFGNAMSFIILLCTYLRRTSASIYLAALSLADLGFLVAIMLSWAPRNGKQLDLYNGLCQITVYLKYLSYFLSVWYIVSFTTERYIAVHFPLRRSHLCTSKRAKIVVITLAVVGALLYGLVTWSFSIILVDGSGTVVCAPRPQYTHLVSYLHNIDTVITLIVPFCLIAVMNVKIAHKVLQFYRERRSMTAVNGGTNVGSRHSSSSASGSGVHHSGKTMRCNSNVHGGSSPRDDRQPRSQVRVTKMLLVISTAFLVMHLPRHTARLYSFISQMIDANYRPSLNYMVCTKVFILIYYLNFALNLFLYSVCGRSFRKAAVWLKNKVVHRMSDFSNRIFHRRTRYSQRHGHGVDRRPARLRGLLYLAWRRDQNSKATTVNVGAGPAKPVRLRGQPDDSEA